MIEMDHNAATITPKIHRLLCDGYSLGAAHHGKPIIGKSQRNDVKMIRNNNSRAHVCVRTVIDCITSIPNES